MQNKEQDATEIGDGLKRHRMSVDEKSKRRETKLNDGVHREAKWANDPERRVQELEGTLRRLDTGGFPAKSPTPADGVPRTRRSIPQRSAGAASLRPRGILARSPMRQIFPGSPQLDDPDSLELNNYPSVQRVDSHLRIPVFSRNSIT